MRTTIILDDHLGERLRQEARNRKQSFSSFIAEAGRLALGESGTRASPKTFKLVTFGEGGVLHGVDLDKTGVLLVAEDEEVYRT
ncbi:MAG: hypothetical protein JJU29_08725 [Verrucomicrobia bacterium]|nr:hypothetical protein [Verrucomicrobiota bacterium]MCH8511248.1 hypothetical protein [Kiritimatiellia bacterium]